VSIYTLYVIYFYILTDRPKLSRTLLTGNPALIKPHIVSYNVKVQKTGSEWRRVKC